MRDRRIQALLRDRRVLIGGGAALGAVLLLGIAFALTRPAPVSALPTPSPPPTATPTPPPDMWRLDGIVIDQQGKPVEGVCVGLGPAVCTDVNPRTDAEGRWHIDLPKITVDYDFHFSKDGYKQVDSRVRPVTHQTFTVTLPR